MNKLFETVLLCVLFGLSFLDWQYLAISAVLILWKISNIYEGKRP